jgi:hypothetical protein
VSSETRRWWVLANMTGSLSLINFNQTSLTVALPSIQRELHVSDTNLQRVVNAYVLALAALVPLAGGSATASGGGRCSSPVSWCPGWRRRSRAPPRARCCSSSPAPGRGRARP